jgi:hypothetical protein
MAFVEALNFVNQLSGQIQIIIDFAGAYTVSRIRSRSFFMPCQNSKCDQDHNGAEVISLAARDEPAPGLRRQGRFRLKLSSTSNLLWLEVAINLSATH